MKGKHRIIVQNKRIRYDFEIKRNITVIRGDSATGKTALIEMIQDYYENGNASAVELNCDKQCAVLAGKTWNTQLSLMEDSIVFIDEGNDFIASIEFATAIQNTDNYYVIVTREGIPTLPYSVEEIYGIRNSGRYGALKRTYNELYHLYQNTDGQHDIVFKKMITEDSNSGFQFFQFVCEKNGGMTCISAQGKSNIFSAVLKEKEQEILVIADGAAFGSEMEKMMQLIKSHANIKLYLPESFEWLILKSGLLEENNIVDILKNPENWIDSKEYFSWERFFTALLIRYTQNGYLRYTKKQLNPVYMQDKIMDKILSAMEGALPSCIINSKLSEQK